MKITFISNYFNHHQKPVSDCFHRHTEGSYFFCQTQRMPEARKKLGYSDDNMPEYVLGESNTEKQYSEIDKSDVVIAGSAPEEMVQRAIHNNKLVFRYSERPLRKGAEPVKYIPRLIRWNMRNPVTKPVYMLCASAFTALDYSKFFLFKNRTYKWGYFPQLKKHDDIDGLIKEKNKTEILWCGRFLKLKHADDVILVASRLKKEGYDFSVKFIGTGEMEDQLKEMTEKLGLTDTVQFAGPVSAEEVRENMEKAGIYLFTSDKQEGWGAVLNESMNSGCAVVASHLIGSVPFMVKNNGNGLVYRSGDVDMLYEKVKYLLDNPQRREKLGKAAYETIINEWNADVAAERFINLSQHMLNGEKYPDLYTSGPCSRAGIIKENWFDYEA